MELKLTFDLLPVLATLLSVLVAIIPGFNTWFDALAKNIKQLLLIGILFGISAAVSALSAFGVIEVYSHDIYGWVIYPIVDWVIAVMTLAGTYKATNYIFEKAVKKSPSG